MKKITILKLTGLLLLSLLLSNNCWAENYTQDANCQGAWLLDETSGTALDTSVNNIDATSQDATINQDGQFGRSYDFSGTTQYVAFGDVIDLSGTTISIVAFVNPDSAAGSNNFRTIIEKGQTSQARENYGLAYGVWATSNSKKLVFEFKTGTFQSAVSSADVPTGEWTHVAGTYDGINIRTWIAGSNDGVTPASSNLTANADSLTIGANSDNSVFEFDGRIDEVAIFSDLLTSTEINDIMDNGLVSAAPPAAVDDSQVFLISKNVR